MSKNLTSDSINDQATCDVGLEMKRHMLRFGVVLAAIFLTHSTWVSVGPLHKATMAGDVEQMKILLLEGADINAADAVGTPLHWAIMSGRSDAIMPLHYAAKAGVAESVQHLVVHGADVNALNAGNQPPLHMAVVGEHKAVIEVLIGNGAALPQVLNIAALIREADPAN